MCLDAARKLAIAAKSHSSSISSLEANQIKDFLKKSNNIKTTSKPSKKLDKEILSVKKSPVKTQKESENLNLSKILLIKKSFHKQS